VSFVSPYYLTDHWKALRAQCFERDGGICTVPGCNHRGIVADHIETRPNVPYATPADRLDNLRLLCRSHDAQVKERRGKRKQSGRFVVRGCDANGQSLDPNHSWKRQGS
jgi:hypothetical protein